MKRLLSTDKKMRAEEVKILIFDFVLLVIGIVCLTLWFTHQTTAYYTIAQVGVMSMFTFIVITTIVGYRIGDNISKQ